MVGTAQAPAPALPAAGLDRRFHAFVLDRVLAWSLYAVAGVLAWQLLDRGAGVRLAVGVVLGAVVLVCLGQAVLVGLRGTSPGKALTGLRVLDESTGSPIGVPTALVRTLLLAAATLPTFGLGIATLAWTALTDRSGRRRGAHDLVTRTVVVDVRPAPVAAEEPTGGPGQMVNLTTLRLLPTQAQPPSPAPARVEPAPPAAVARWRVSVDTGESLLVEGLALLGRRPEPRAGEPVRHLLALRSGDMSLSKTHAQLQVAPDGVLVVMDRGSTNGSVLLRQGVPRPLPPGRPVTLVAGDRVRLGDRELAVAREG